MSGLGASTQPLSRQRFRQGGILSDVFVSRRVRILGCGFDPITELEAVKTILGWCDTQPRETHTIVTVNVAILMMMRSHQQLRDAVAQANLVVADGTPLIWASKWLSAKLPERVTGVDLMERLLREGARCNLRVFLLGTTQERLAVLTAVIRERFTGIQVVGSRNGYF